MSEVRVEVGLSGGEEGEEEDKDKDKDAPLRDDVFVFGLGGGHG